jgi:tRNA A-37 threonylcarbamoyl transferase component Bud32
MHHITWERSVRIERRQGRHVIVKESRRTRPFRMFLLAVGYSGASVLFLTPTPPFPTSETSTLRNEGLATRTRLQAWGITTPSLLDAMPGKVVEEYVAGIDGRRFLEAAPLEACEALGEALGDVTARMHQHGCAFHDNKAQNYLVDGRRIQRVDLTLFTAGAGRFAMLTDIATFLASILDLDGARFRAAQRGFCRGYTGALEQRIPVLAFGLRNLVSLLLSPAYGRSVRNMFAPIATCLDPRKTPSRV